MSTSRAVLPSASATAPTFSVGRRVDVDHVDRAPGRRRSSPCRSRAGEEHRAALGDCDHGDRVRLPERGQPRPLERVDRDVHLRPAGRSPTSSPLKSIGASSFSPSPITTTPPSRRVSRTKRIASTAAWSAALLVAAADPARRRHRAASVTRTSSSARLRSGAVPRAHGGAPIRAAPVEARVADRSSQRSCVVGEEPRRARPRSSRRPSSACSQPERNLGKPARMSRRRRNLGAGLGRRQPASSHRGRGACRRQRPKR